MRHNDGVYPLAPKVLACPRHTSLFSVICLMLFSHTIRDVIKIFPGVSQYTKSIFDIRHAYISLCELSLTETSLSSIFSFTTFVACDLILFCEQFLSRKNLQRKKNKFQGTIRRNCNFHLEFI